MTLLWLTITIMFDKLKDVADIFHSFLRYPDIQFQTCSM